MKKSPELPPSYLPEHAFPFQDYELERTDLFRIINEHGDSRKNQPIILAGFRDPGETNAIIPVIRRLSESPVNIFVLTDSSGKNLLMKSDLKYRSFKPLDPLLRISSINAAIIIAGMSAAPGIALTLTANAKFYKTTVIWIEDNPGAILPYYRNVRNTTPGILPDYFFVANDWAKKKELDYLKGFDSSKVIVTGQPVLDSIAGENRQETQSEVRQKLSINPEEKLIVYMGIPTIASAEALEVLVKGINDLGLRNFRLVNRRHPRDTSPQALYDQITASIESKMVDTSEFSTAEIGMAADLIVTTYSFEGAVAVYRGIPSIHILIADILAKTESRGNIPIPPPVSDKSSFAVYQAKEMTEALKQSLFNPESLKLKMANWQIDGRATARVAEQILKIINDNQNR